MLRSQAKVVEGFEWNGRMSQKHPGTVADDMRRAADYSAPVFEKP